MSRVVLKTGVPGGFYAKADALAKRRGTTLAAVLREGLYRWYAETEDDEEVAE